MRPRVVTVFAITGFCLSSKLAAAAAQGSLWSSLSSGRKRSLHHSSQNHPWGGEGVPWVLDGLWGSRGRARACSSHHSGDGTCSSLPCQG